MGKTKEGIMDFRESMKYLGFEKKSKLEKRVNELESLVFKLIEETGYAVVIDDLNPEWQYPELIKKPEEKK